MLVLVTFVSFLCFGIGALAVSADDRTSAPHVMVLNYHKIDDMDISLAVPPADFERQMEYLSQKGYNVITVDDFRAAVEDGKELPKNAVLITFDDGYADNYTNAYPILKKYKFPATIFVITDFVGKENYLTWDNLRQMQKDGISIESHTATHKSLTDLSDEDLRRELVASREKIESELGTKVSFIAYPTGAYNLHIAQLTKEAGYMGAFTVKYGNADENSNVYAIERVPVFHTENTMKSFVERLHYTPLLANSGWLKR